MAILQIKGIDDALYTVIYSLKGHPDVVRSPAARGWMRSR